MLISYPILPAGADNQSEDERFTTMLALVQRDRGVYPVTTGNRWHGGVHLTPGDEPIRAVADGVIVAYRLAPDTKEYPGQGSYDTSFVLLKHETDSGENTRVVFYSLYMHLRPKGLLNNARRQQLAPFLRDASTDDAAAQAPPNTRVWRKEVLGFSGQLYGHPTVHFEIFANAADFDLFWRDRSAIASGNNGSNDAFGDVHFIIPANQQFVERHPRAVAPHRIDLPGQNQFYVLPVGSAGRNTDRLHAVVNLSNGRRTATTYRLDSEGQIAEQVGQPVQQEDYEYELYRLATALYPDCPSAGFDYLRFGRTLGPDTTTRVENWQLIRYSNAEIGYINLADPTHQVSVLSDADFPMLWQRVEEGEAASPTDNIANVARLTELLDLPDAAGAQSLSAPVVFATRLVAAEIASTLRHLICRHPSEWDASDLETRYADLRRPGGPLAGDTQWNDFKDHVDAMAFWPHAGTLERSVWHFHPLQFIRHYRNCLWLSVNEFARCLPRRSRSDTNLTWTTAHARASTISSNYNEFIRKYCGSSRTRYAHNLAQSFIETGLFRTTTEDGRGRGMAYDAFYGRGYHQLTWAGTYRSYGSYKNLPNHAGAYTDTRINATSTHAVDSGGTQFQWAPRYDPAIIENSAHHAGDSSGFFWVSKSFRGRKNMNRVGDLNFGQVSVGFCSWLINGGGHGYAHRQQFAKFLSNVLLDGPLEVGSAVFSYPPLTPAGNPTLCRTFPPTNVAHTLQETVHYDKQIP